MTNGDPDTLLGSPVIPTEQLDAKSTPFIKTHATVPQNDRGKSAPRDYTRVRLWMRLKDLVWGLNKSAKNITMSRQRSCWGSRCRKRRQLVTITTRETYISRRGLPSSSRSSFSSMSSVKPWTWGQSDSVKHRRGDLRQPSPRRPHTHSGRQTLRRPVRSEVGCQSLIKKP